MKGRRLLCCNEMEDQHANRLIHIVSAVFFFVTAGVGLMAKKTEKLHACKLLKHPCTSNSWRHSTSNQNCKIRLQRTCNLTDMRQVLLYVFLSFCSFVLFWKTRVSITVTTDDSSLTHCPKLVSDLTSAPHPGR